MFSGAASAIKNRLRFNNGGNSMAAEAPNQLTSSKSTPDLSLKSALKDNVSSSLQIRKISDGFDDDDDNLGQTNPMTRSFEFREDPSFWEDHNVQVIIRLRPLNSSELSVQGQSRCVRQDCSQSITWTGNPESRFTFDHVADEHVSQEMLFKVAGVPMVENTVGGYNSCMFAYGQTGSGKTHTMLGDIEEGTRRHSVNCGMTPRVFEYLFSRIQKEKEVRRDEKIRFTSRCSFLEIYNEHILDLLDPSSTNLQIREDTKKGVYVENLTEVEVTSARDVIQQLVQGAANRKVASTNMNRASSRSHSVFTCVVESKWESQGVTHHRFSRLNLVDLAGSERQKSSGAEGERLKEATNINKSLSTLGLVIMNLVNMSNGKSLHIPYRDSKLTFLLQDSLGGNAKTIIIANISPSSCSALETLSTLKFAQRAKFIKNNAIVNEDASGDVLAMRSQIQNLKKEVAHLRGLVNGGADNHEDDSCFASVPGTPGPFKWDGLNELSTPLTKPHKKTSKNEYEIALVGAFRREKDKDIVIQSLTSENQAALQLTKQREDEIQGLKMRLRFREAAIKRLEAVASGKISAETHLIKERDEHLKEIEVLRTEVACNPEVTRFAMENLRVKEEIRRLKSFYEEGERERMMEQITMLQNKLLEALDWKLMNESNLSTVQKERSRPGMDIQDDGFLLTSGQESTSPWRTAVNEENEFLRMQAIHNQSELDALHKRLEFCIHEKEKLESHVKDLEAELERTSRSMVPQESQKDQLELSVVTNDLMPCSAVCDQVELKTLVDAIATASEREAEAHELAITLSKENDQLKMKLKVLLDDNNKLIELYERTVSENQTGNGSQGCLENVADVTTLTAQKELDGIDEADSQKLQSREMHEENDRLMALYEKAAQKELDVVTAEVGKLKQQLMELHEENDKLMGLYEKAMQERDEFKWMLVSAEQKYMDLKADSNRPEKLVEIDGDQGQQFNFSEARSNNVDIISENEAKSTNIVDVRVFEDMNLIRRKLVEAQEKLSNSALSLTVFSSLEKAIQEVDELSGEIERLNNRIQVKQESFESSKQLSLAQQERRAVLDKKLIALKYTIVNFVSSVGYFGNREAQARARYTSSLASINKNKEELARLEICKGEIMDAQSKLKQSEVELKNNLAALKVKLEDENRRLEKDRVLVAIDNVEKTDTQTLQTNWQLTGKATDLLKSEEEIPKLQIQIKKTEEKHTIMKKDAKELDRRAAKVDNDIKTIQEGIQNSLLSVEELRRKLQSITQDKESVLSMQEEGRKEFENKIHEYYECIFEAEMREEETKILEEDVEVELSKLKKLQNAMVAAVGRKAELMEEITCQSCIVSDKIEEDLYCVNRSIMEVNSMLGDFDSNDS